MPIASWQMDGGLSCLLVDSYMQVSAPVRIKVLYLSTCKQGSPIKWPQKGHQIYYYYLYHHSSQDHHSWTRTLLYEALYKHKWSQHTSNLSTAKSGVGLHSVWEHRGVCLPAFGSGVSHPSLGWIAHWLSHCCCTVTKRPPLFWKIHLMFSQS